MKNMTNEEFDKWVSTYIERQGLAREPDAENDPLFWSVLKFMDLNDEDPELCWRAILEILQRKPRDKVLGVLAAGPLEDLIEYHGPDFIEKIEREAIANPALKHLLGGVWQSSTPGIWARIEAIRGSTW
jgi:hypothetical protein